MTQGVMNHRVMKLGVTIYGVATHGVPTPPPTHHRKHPDLITSRLTNPLTTQIVTTVPLSWVYWNQTSSGCGSQWTAACSRATVITPTENMTCSTSRNDFVQTKQFVHIAIATFAGPVLPHLIRAHSCHLTNVYQSGITTLWSATCQGLHEATP